MPFCLLPLNYLIKYQAKQKYLLSYYFTNNNLKEYLYQQYNLKWYRHKTQHIPHFDDTVNVKKFDPDKIKIN